MGNPVSFWANLIGVVVGTFCVGFVKIILLKSDNCVLTLRKRLFCAAKPTLLPCKTAAFGMQNNRFCNTLITRQLSDSCPCEKYLQFYNRFPFIKWWIGAKFYCYPLWVLIVLLLNWKIQKMASRHRVLKPFLSYLFINQSLRIIAWLQFSLFAPYNKVTLLDSRSTLIWLAKGIASGLLSSSERYFSANVA